MQRRQEEKRQEYKSKYDSEGNRILSSGDESEESYDSMELASDYFSDFSDAENAGNNQLSAKELDRIERLKIYKAQMDERKKDMRRRQEAERRLQMRGEAEVQAGLNTLDDEDKKLFEENVTKASAGVFGFLSASRRSSSSQQILFD